MYLSGSQNIQKSMNGILRIRASEISADDAYLTNISNVQTINGLAGQNLVIDVDTGKVIEFKDDVLMDASLNVIGAFDVSGNAQFDSSVNISKNLIIGTGGGYADVTGDIYIRDPLDPTNNKMRIYYNPLNAGFNFLSQKLNGYMYFSVMNGASNVRSFQFSYGQAFMNMPMYHDNGVAVSYNNNLIFGDTNFTTSNFGCICKYVPNTAVTSGMNFYNKGLNNNQAYYTNFSHNDLTNTEVATLRMNYNNIWSKVPHTFESSLIGQDASFNTTLSVGGTSTLKTINGTSLNITGSSSFGNTITADSLSVINASNFNGNANFISTSQFIGVATFQNNLIGNLNGHFNTFDVSGNSIFNGSTTNYGNTYFNNDIYMQVSSKLFAFGVGITQQELSYLSGVTSAIQTQISSKLNLTGGTLTGNLNISITTGSNTFSSALQVNNTITTNNNITQTGTTATTNKISQNRVSGDLTGNLNILKYTRIAYNSSTADSTDRFVLQLTDESANRHINFLPNASSGSFNGLINLHDRAIIAVDPAGLASALTLTTFGASASHGMRIYHTSSSNYSSEIWANTYNFKLNSVNGLSTSVGTNGLVMNSTNTTISGPIICSGSAQLNGGVLLTTTTLLNNNILQYGSSVINQDMAGVYSGTNNFKITTVSQKTSATGTGTPAFLVQDLFNSNSLMLIPNSSLSAYNPINSVNCQSITSQGGGVIDSATLCLSVWGTLKNGVKVSTTSSSNAQVELYAGTTSIIMNNSSGTTMTNVASQTFTDASVQNTAYTNTLNTKLNAIGTVYQAILTASTTLVTATQTSIGSITLPVGIYMITVCGNLSVVVGATTVGALSATYSTSSSTFSQTTNLAIINAGNFSYSASMQWCLNTSGIVQVASSTTFYLLVSANFGTANRIISYGSNSNLTAVRIA